MTRRALRVSLLAGAALLLGALALDRMFPPDLRRLRELGSEVVDREGRAVAYLPAKGGVWRLPAAPDTVSPVLRDLLIATEDRRFYWHPGVDPVALVRAVGQLIRHGHVVSGGSTLAMQAARLLTPRPRTLGAKLIEMARAVQLEWRFGREGVLRIWMTLAPYGGNLEGVQSGSLAWLGHGPEAVEPDEAALLVAIPRRPEALRPDRHAEALAAVRARVLALGVHDALFAADEVMPAPVPLVRQPIPRHAAQLAARLPRAPRIETTLDLPLQMALERLAAERLQSLPARTSLAMVVLDAGSGEIRAAYGGAWGDAARAGALDLTQAVRSPGSALKPFIYGLAFQEGIVGPETVLADLPRLFGAYAPENFDRGFTGGITAAEALRQSLNLPAVQLLERVGPLRFTEALRLAGVRMRLPLGASASLPLALGGGGITLRDGASLYTALAADGAVRGAHVLAGAAGPPLPLISHDSAAAVADILNRPFPGSTAFGVAWKTGTSWGGRDAWAFGFDRLHVVGVWFGRPDGTPVAAFEGAAQNVGAAAQGATGAGLALPMLARVFGLLPAAPRPAPALARADRAAKTVSADRLRLLFPPQGAVLSGDGPVTLRAMGGQRPLVFLIDGAKVDSAMARRETNWQPAGPGFYRITVLDAGGEAARATIRVR
jgi:penicillin-binding protein 1C